MKEVAKPLIPTIYSHSLTLSRFSNSNSKQRLESNTIRLLSLSSISSINRVVGQQEWNLFVQKIRSDYLFSLSSINLAVKTVGVHPNGIYRAYSIMEYLTPPLASFSVACSLPITCFVYLFRSFFLCFKSN